MFINTKIALKLGENSANVGFPTDPPKVKCDEIKTERNVPHKNALLFL